MRCFHCQAENDHDSGSCKKCGKPFVRGGARRERTSREEYPHKQGLAALALLKEKKRNRIMVVLLTGFGFAAVFGTGAYFQQNTLLGAAAFVTVILSFIVGTYLGRIREAEYAVLPGARDMPGNHRCVHCGNRGIWKRTPYQTNSTIAACSKCKEELYYE